MTRMYWGIAIIIAVLILAGFVLHWTDTQPYWLEAYWNWHGFATFLITSALIFGAVGGLATMRHANSDAGEFGARWSRGFWTFLVCFTVILIQFTPDEATRAIRYVLTPNEARPLTPPSPDLVDSGGVRIVTPRPAKADGKVIEVEKWRVVLEVPAEMSNPVGGGLVPTTIPLPKHATFVELSYTEKQHRRQSWGNQTFWTP